MQVPLILHFFKKHVKCEGIIIKPFIFLESLEICEERQHAVLCKCQISLQKCEGGTAGCHLFFMLPTDPHWELPIPQDSVAARINSFLRHKAKC